MRSQTFDQLLQRLSRTLHVFWLSFLVFPIVLTVSAIVLTREAPPQEPPVPLVPYLLTAAAGVSLILSFARTLFMSDKWIRESAQDIPDPTSLATNPQSGQVNQKLKDSLERLSEAELKAYKVIAESLGRHLIQWGIIETIALYGFVLTTMTLRFDYYLLFGTAALLRLLTAKPSVDGLLTRIRSVLERHS